MAVTIDTLNAISNKYIVPKLFDNVFESNPILKRLQGSGQYMSVSGGTSIDLPLAYAQTTASGWYSGADVLATQENEQVTAARLSWCSLYAGITITEEDELKNGGSSGVLKILATKAQMAEKTIKDALGTGLYSDGTDTKSIIGLRDWIAVDQSPGGIAQATNSWYQGIVDSTTTTMSLSALNTNYENASVGDEKPTVIVSGRTPFTKYYNLLAPMQRFTDSNTASGGFQNLLFNGVPYIVDTHSPALHVWGLNEKHLWLCYHPERNFSQEPFAKPIGQQVKVSRFLWMGAFGSSNNRMHFKMSAVAA